MSVEFKKMIKIGDTVTAKVMGANGEESYVSGEVPSINGEIVFIVARFPKVTHHSVKIQNIIPGENTNGK